MTPRTASPDVNISDENGDRYDLAELEPITAERETQEEPDADR